MQLRYAGVDLLLEDTDQVFQTWLERSLSLRDCRLFAQSPIDLFDGRDRPRGEWRAKVGMGTFNWHYRPPRWKINTLWWPTGATRWSIGLFLVDDEGLREIVQNLDEDGKAKLIISDDPRRGTAGRIEPQMYLLPPRRLNHSETGIRGWLIVLVDERFFWQSIPVDLMEVSEADWDQVLAVISDTLDITIHADPSPGMQIPDTVEMLRQHESAGMLLDAAAASMGLRLCYTLANGVVLINSDNSRERLEGNIRGWPEGFLEYTPEVAAADWGDSQAPLLAGGQSVIHNQAMYPSAVRVIFRQAVDGEPKEDGSVYEITSLAETYTSAKTVPGTRRTIYTTALAEYSDEDDETPSNLARMTTLADAITKAHYGWLGQQYDMSFLGLKLWAMNGFDDFVWIHCGHRYPPETPNLAGWNDRYTFHTRVCSLPYDFGVCEQLQAFGEEEEGSSGSSSSSSESSESGSSSSSSSESGSSSSSSSESTSGSSSSSDSSSSEPPCINHFEVTVDEIPGFVEANLQFLAHENGCLKWIDAAPCPSS